MRSWILKSAGVALWSFFLFAPFIAQADEGFDIYLPLAQKQVTAGEDDALFSLGGYQVRFDQGAVLQDPEQDKWSLKFSAGKDTVLKNDLSPEVRHDRLPLDDGERESFRFGIGLNYTF